MIPAVTPRKQTQGTSLHLAGGHKNLLNPELARLDQLKWNRCRKLVFCCFCFCFLRHPYSLTSHGLVSPGPGNLRRGTLPTRGNRKTISKSSSAVSSYILFKCRFTRDATRKPRRADLPYLHVSTSGRQWLLAVFYVLKRHVDTPATASRRLPSTPSQIHNYR